MSFGKLIIAANHSGDPSDVPAKTIDAIKNTKHIFCDYFRIFQEDLINFHSIDVSDKVIVETGPRVFDNGISDDIIEILKTGKDVIFITDHGLPGFADKGAGILHDIYNQGIDVRIIPGPSIAALAIAISGIMSSADEYYAMSIFNYELSQKIKKFKMQ